MLAEYRLNRIATFSLKDGKLASASLLKFHTFFSRVHHNVYVAVAVFFAFFMVDIPAAREYNFPASHWAATDPFQR